MTVSWWRRLAGPGRRPRLQQPDGPPVSGEHLAGRASSPFHLGPPVTAGSRKLDLAEDDVDQGVEDLVLVGDVVVDRHRLDAQLLGEGADRQRSQPVGVGDATARPGARARASAALRRGAAFGSLTPRPSGPSVVSPLWRFRTLYGTVFVLSTTTLRARDGHLMTTPTRRRQHADQHHDAGRRPEPLRQLGGPAADAGRRDPRSARTRCWCRCTRRDSTAAPST